MELNPIRKLWNGIKHLSQIHFCASLSTLPGRWVRELERLHTSWGLFQYQVGVNSLEFSDCYIGETLFLALEKKKNASGTESLSENKEGPEVSAPWIFPIIGQRRRAVNLGSSDAVPLVQRLRSGNWVGYGCHSYSECRPWGQSRGRFWVCFAGPSNYQALEDSHAAERQPGIAGGTAVSTF